MNKNCYRLVVNNKRGMLMAVAECAKGRHKAASGERAPGAVSMLWVTLRPMAWALLVSLGCVQLAGAQIVADPNAGRGPGVSTAPNGTALVNIQAPSAAGVSHNQYNQFSVDGRGAILNNATGITATQLGGYVPGNANLGASGPARVILNEVTGTHPSQLNGYIEVAGQRADVVISNLNGISINGGGFLNTNRATLTTGAPVFGGDGSLAAFRVTRGGIQVQGQGFNGSNLDQVDLIARSVAINGQLWARTANVIAGANQVDYANLGVQVIQEDADQPTVGIDVSNLGGMYANRIRLIGSEAGVGVRNAGTLAAQAGDFSIDTAGRISLAGTTSSAGALTVRGAQAVDNVGTTAAAGNLSVSSDGAVGNTGALIAGRDLAVSGGSVQSNGTLGAGIDANGEATQPGNLVVTGARHVAVNGQNLATGKLSVSGASVSAAGSQTRAGETVMLGATAGDLDLSGAAITAGQSLTANAVGMLRSDNARITATELNALAQRLSNRGGSLYAQRGTTLSIRGDADNTGGALLTDAGTLSLSADGKVTNAGGRITNAGTGDTTVQAARIENSATGATAGDGVIGGNGGLAITTAQLANTSGGQLIAGTDLSLHVTQSADNSGGLIQATQRVTADGSQTAWRNDGGTIAGQSVHIDGASLSNRGGSVLAKASIDTTIGGDIDNAQGVLQGGKQAAVTATGSISNDGGQLISVDAGSTATVRAASVLNTNGGVLGGNGSLSVTADQLSNTQSAEMIAATGLAIHARESADNTGGQIRAGGVLILDDAGAGAALTNDGGKITAGTVVLAGKSLSNRQGSIVSNGALSASVTGDIDNTGGTVEAADVLSVSAMGALDNTGGRLVSTGTADATITAATVDNSQRGLLGGNGNVTLTAGALANTQDAQLIAGKDLQLKLSTTADNSGGKIDAAQRLVLDGSQVAWRNDGGTVSGKSVQFAGGSLSNRQGKFIADDGLAATIGGDVDNAAGTLQAGDTLAVTAGGRLGNDGGEVINTGKGSTTVGAASIANANKGTIGGNGSVDLRAQQLVNTDASKLVSGTDLRIDAAQSFTNAGGQVYGGTRLELHGQAATVINDGGSLASGGDSAVHAATLSNQGGKVVTDGDMAVDAGSLAGTGTIHAGRDLSIDTRTDYVNTAGNVLKAERDLKFSTTGTLTNRATLEAVGALTADASRIVNAAGATVNSASTTLNASADIVNAGRFEGDKLATNSDVLDNTGTLIGNEVTASAREIRNTGAAAIMAAADTLNVYGRDRIANTEGATLYSLGDVNIAANGERDARGMLRNRTGVLLNDSSTIEGGSDYSVVEIAAQDIINQRPDPVIVSDTTVETRHELKREKYIHCATTNAYPQMGCTQELWEGPYKKPVDAAFNAGQVLSRDDARKRLTVDIDGVATQIDYNTLTESNGVLQVNYWDGYNRDIHYDPGTEYATYNDAQRGWQRVEIARDTTTTTVTERDANPNQPAGNLISGGDMILANVGTLTNRYSTVAAGGNMVIGEQAASGDVASGQFGTTTVNNVGQTLYRRTTQDIVSTYAWSKDTTQDVGPVVQPTVVNSPEVVGKVSGSITAGHRLTVYGGDVHNQDVGRSDPMAGTGSTNVTGQDVAGATPIRGSGGDAGVSPVSGKTLGKQSVGVATLANAPLRLPGNGLYTYHTEPGHGYLIETDSRFTQYNNFVSSDYMLGLLGVDPAMTQKRLGDGFYEQKLIRDQVTQLSGRTYLAGYDSAEEQYKALMAAGANFAREFSLMPGLALSAAQMDALTTDIVWLVSESVTLPDGSTQSVLVPRIYLARAHAADLQANGALIAADDLELHSSGTMRNSGIVDAGSRLSIAAKEDVINRGGTLRSEGITVISADRDVLNLSGQISGNKVGLVAGRDIQNVTLFDQKGVQSAAGNSKASTSLYGRQAGISSAGDMVLSAKRDIAVTGARIDAGGDAMLIAGRNLTLDTLAGKTGQSVFNSDKHHSENVRTEHTVSAVNTGGSLTTSSGGDTVLKGAQVKAGTDLTMIAGGDLTASAVTNETSHDNVARQSRQRQQEEHRRDQTTVAVDLSAGGNATLAAVKAVDQGGGADRTDGKGNVALTGANVTAGSDGKGISTLSVTADRDVAIGEARERHDSSVEIQRKSGSFLARSSSNEQVSSHSNLGVGSTLSGDTVRVKAGNDVTVRQSAIAATDGVALTATRGDVLITAGENIREDSAAREVKTSGLSGFAGQGGIGIGLGKSEASGSSHTLAITQSDARSVVGASNGNVVITAGKNAAIVGSDVIAGRKDPNADKASTGNIDILAQNVTIAEGVDRIQQDASQRNRSSGLSFAVVGTPLDTVKNLQGAQQNPSTVSRAMGVMKELGASGLTMPQVNVSIGSQKSSAQSSSVATASSGSSLAGAGNVRIRATGNGEKDAGGKAIDGNILASGSTITAGDAAILDAARDVTLRASTDTYQESNNASSSGWKLSSAAPTPGDIARHIGGGPNNSGVGMVPYGNQKSNGSGDIASSKQNATVVTGNTVGIRAQTGDITAAGSGIAAEKDVALSAAKGRIDILSGRDTLSQRSDSSSRQLGDLGGTGYAGTVGVRSESHHADANQSTQNTIRSQIASRNGSVTLNAGEDITARGADISAGTDVTMIGKNVILDPGADTTSQNESHRVSQYGTTLALSGYTVNAVQAVENAARAVEEKKDTRVATLYGVQAGLAITNGIQGIQTVTSGGTSPTAAVKVTASIGGGSTTSESHTQSSSHQGTTVKAGNAVTIVAKGSGQKGGDGYTTDGDISGRGVQIEGKTVTLSAARDVNLESAQDRSSQDSRSSGSNAGIGVGFGLGGDQNGFTLELAASQNKTKVNGEAVTNHNSHVTGTDKVTVVSGRDTNLKGAQLIGEEIDGTVGRDLNIESRPDIETYHARESSSGMQASICVPPFCYGTTVHANANVNQGKTDSTYSPVQEQSGLYAGKGGFNVDVKGNTHLKGGVLASAGDADKNRLVTGTLTTSDIENKAEYSSGSSTLVASYSGGESVRASDPSLGPVQPAHVDWGGKTNLLQGLANSIGATAAGNAQKPVDGSASGVTKSGIAAGTVTITDNAGQLGKTGKSAEETIASLNRDTENANQSIDKIFDAQKVKDKQELNQLTNQVAQQLAPMVYKQVGEALKREPEPVKVAVHALVGGLLSKALGGDFGTGAMGVAAGTAAIALLNEQLGTMGLSEASRNAVLKMVGMAVATAVGGGGAEGGAAAATTGLADTYNRQLHNLSDADLRRKAADLSKDPRYAGMTVQEIYYAIRSVYRNDQVGTGDLKKFDTRDQANAAGVPVSFDPGTGKWLEDPEVATARLDGSQRTQLDSQLRSDLWNAGGAFRVELIEAGKPNAAAVTDLALGMISGGRPGAKEREQPIGKTAEAKGANTTPQVEQQGSAIGGAQQTSMKELADLFNKGSPVNEVSLNGQRYTATMDSNKSGTTKVFDTSNLPDVQLESRARAFVSELTGGVPLTPKGNPPRVWTTTLDDGTTVNLRSVSSSTIGGSGDQARWTVDIINNPMIKDVVPRPRVEIKFK